jgi:hypothetical protein
MAIIRFGTPRAVESEPILDSAAHQNTISFTRIRMNPLDAFYHTVHDFPGGTESLAPRMGMSAAVLRNKADLRKDSNKPLLADADVVMGITKDFRILRALAHKHGFLMVKAPEHEGTSCDMNVLEQVVGLNVACGVFSQEIYTALADGKVDRNELERIGEASVGVHTAVKTLEQGLAGMSE